MNDQEKAYLAAAVRIRTAVTVWLNSDSDTRTLIDVIADSAAVEIQPLVEALEAVQRHWEFIGGKGAMEGSAIHIITSQALARARGGRP